MPIQAGGTQKFWFKGESFEGVAKAVSPPDTGNQKYWLKGKSAEFIVPTGTVTAHDDYFMYTIAF